MPKTQCRLTECCTRHNVDFPDFTDGPAQMHNEEFSDTELLRED